MTDSQLAFDQERAAAMLTVYRTPALVARRREAIGALDLHAGERLLDAGCGPGLFAIDAVSHVAPGGAVVGFDVSPDMVTVAERVKAESERADLIEFHEAHVASQPFEDGTSMLRSRSRCSSTSRTSMRHCARSIACSGPADDASSGTRTGEAP